MRVILMEWRTKKRRVCEAMKMTVGYKLFKKRASHLVSYEYGLSKTQEDQDNPKGNFKREESVIH